MSVAQFKRLCLEVGESVRLKGNMRAGAVLQGGGFGFYHDILVTEHYYIAVENPMRMDFAKFLLGYGLGRACLAECLQYDPRRRSKLHLIPRPGRPGEFMRWHAVAPAHLHACPLACLPILLPSTAAASRVGQRRKLSARNSHLLCQNQCMAERCVGGADYMHNLCKCIMEQWLMV